MTIQIAGLSDKQKRILDIMWNLPTSDDLQRWRKNLPEDELKLSLSLEELLKAEFIDTIIVEEDDTILAQEILNSIWKK